MAIFTDGLRLEPIEGTPISEITAANTAYRNHQILVVSEILLGLVVLVFIGFYFPRVWRKVTTALSGYVDMPDPQKPPSVPKGDKK
jgi:hypothetical protein